MKTILILSANPKNSSALRIDEEMREIQAGLERSPLRQQFQVLTRSALRPEDLRRALLTLNPQIVHFSGHGLGSEGIALEDDLGKLKLVSSAALGRLFRQFNGIECVVLNACYSQVQAEVLAQSVPYVVGMTQAIGDRAAIEFATGFYDGLGAGRDYPAAFEFGLTGIDLEGIPEVNTPVLLRQASPSEPPTLAAPSSPASPPISPPGAQVFISYRSQHPDQPLAEAFRTGLEAAGYSAFMAAESIRLGEDWAQRIDQELATCEYFLLLLSERSALSEMVTEEVRRAKQLRDQTGKPLILPIRVNFPMDSPLNYDLRGYLQRIQQRQWQQEHDTATILAEILALMAAPGTSRKATVVLASPAQAAPTPEAAAAQAPSDALDPPTIAETLAHQESVQIPPLPVAEPELPGGQVDLASRFYVERRVPGSGGSIEARCYEAIAQPGALIRIKAPRQMGKTSLMSRILRHAEQQGCLGVPLSFQIADAVVFGELDKFLRWFSASIGRRLKLANKLNDYWDDVFGSKDNCTAYFEEYILPNLNQPLTLCLDEVDMVFQHQEIAADFFGLLRNWHEMGKSSDLWKQFRLVVVHSTEVYIPMNINQSPFNVGLPIELPEFTPEQVQDLAARHGLNWNTSQIGRLMGMVGGHPYLVRLALYHLARGDGSLEALLRNAPMESGLYADHLRRHLWNLEQHPSLAAAVRRLVATDGPVRLESVQAFQLHSMGLVDLLGNDVTFRSQLYRAYFGDRLSSR